MHFCANLITKKYETALLEFIAQLLQRGNARLVVSEIKCIFKMRHHFVLRSHTKLLPELQFGLTAAF